MKKLLLAATVAALSATVAQAAPTVYGKAFLSLDVKEGDVVEKVKEQERTQLNSISSRIGFKGAEKLSAQTDLVYQLEYGVRVDDDSKNFTSRDTYLGLSNKQFGTVLAGRLTAIDDMVNYANVAQGGVLGGNDVLASFNGERANNAFAYVSPNYNGVNFLGMYVLDENKATDTLGRDAFGVGVQYEPAGAPFKAGATYIQAGDLKASRVSGSYDVTSAITAAALYQNTNYGKGAKKENALTVSGSYNIAGTPWTTYAQADLVDNFEGEDIEKQRAVLGSKYAFNKQTTGHVYGAYLRQKENGNSDDGVGVGAGIEYKF